VKAVSLVKTLLDWLLDAWSEVIICTREGDNTCAGRKLDLSDFCPACKVRFHLLAAFHAVEDIERTMKAFQS
jgi:hypothetical protein